VADFVVTCDGRWIAGYSFIYICRTVKGIVKFQAVQERLGRIEVLLVTDGDFATDGEEQVRQKVLARLKSQDEVVVRRVPDIQPAPSGKYRPVIGKVAEELRRGGAATDMPVGRDR
jgi:phenylacetate-CoA ligase